MDFAHDGRRVHASTGGRPFDPSLPTVVFLHGAGMDCTVWSLQSRWFAHHGYAVLAFDLPGHGRSDGPPLPTIETLAEWVASTLGYLGAAAVCLVGHSLGSFVALATAALYPALVSRLALVGTALRMKVGPDLLSAAEQNSSDAISMINLWSYGQRAIHGTAEMPGMSMTGSGQRLLERALPGVLFNDLRACDAYRPEPLISAITCPALILQGTRDLMTPLKGAKALQQAFSGSRLVPIVDAGHMPMVECGHYVSTQLATEFRAPNE